MPVTPSLQLPLVDGAFFVSSSFLDKACPREQQHYKLDARVLAKTPAGAAFGKHLHTGFNMHYKGNSHEVAECFDKLWEADPVDCPFRTLPWAQEIWEHYREKFKHEPWEIVVDPDTGRPMTEHKFATPLTMVGDVPVFFHGIIDLVVKVGTLAYILDFKSTSMLGKSYWDTQRASQQYRGYAWAIAPKLERMGLTMDGYIVRAIRTSPPTQKMRAAGGAPLREWWDTTLADEKYLFVPGELEEWRFNAIQLVHQFAQHARAGYFPQVKSCCVKKDHVCDYYEVCQAEASSRDRILNSLQYADKLDPFLEPAK